MVLLVSEIKRREAERRAAFVDLLVERLRATARAEGGRYLLYGSAAEKRMRYDSDIDLLTDFPDDKEGIAWEAAEDLCRAHDIPLDIKPVRYCTEAFLARVRPKALVIE